MGFNSFVLRLEGTRYCPRIVCGHCGEPISDLDATVAWIQDNRFDEGTQYPVTVLCKKNGCAGGGILIPGKGVRSRPLKEYLTQLLHNLGAERMLEAEVLEK